MLRVTQCVVMRCCAAGATAGAAAVGAAKTENVSNELDNTFDSHFLLRLQERLLVQQLGAPGFFHVIARYGYAQQISQGEDFVRVRRMSLDTCCPRRFLRCTCLQVCLDTKWSRQAAVWQAVPPCRRQSALSFVCHWLGHPCFLHKGIGQTFRRSAALLSTLGNSFRRPYQLVNHTCQQILSVHAQDVVRHMQALLYRALCHRVVQTDALAPLASRRKVCPSFLHFIVSYVFHYATAWCRPTHWRPVPPAARCFAFCHPPLYRISFLSCFLPVVLSFYHVPFFVSR